MQATTEKNLSDAFAGESQAHMKYKVFADLAERERLPNVARLFRAASFSEQAHATNHLRALGGAKKTIENLATALAGETFEITTMYPEYIAKAGEEGEKRALGSMEDALAAEKVHARLYAAAHEAVTAGHDLALPKVWVCPVCGFTMEGDEAPEKCPVCNAPKKQFQAF